MAWWVEQASVVQMSFLVAPKVLDELRHHVQVDERVMRHMFYKNREKPTLAQVRS